MPIYRSEFILTQRYTFLIEADNEVDAERIAKEFEDEPSYVLDGGPDTDEWELDDVVLSRHQNEIPDYDIEETRGLLGVLDE